MRGAMIVAMTLLLGGCKEGGAITCPTIKHYSTTFMAAVASELEHLGSAAPHLTQMLNDYGVERDAIRECLRRQTPVR